MKGKQPENLRTASVDCAHRMGYFCVENTETTLPFDGLMYRDTNVVAVRLKKTRVPPRRGFPYRQEIPGRGCGSPRPSSPAYRVPRTLAPHPERTGIPAILGHPGYTTVEIEEITRDGYRNPHYHEGYWEKAPYKATLYFADRGKGRKAEGENDTLKTP